MNSLQVSPSTVDFGAVPIGQMANTVVSMLNRGARAVEVSQLSVAGQTFSVASQNQLPITISPGEAYNVKVGFKPSAGTSYSGKLNAIDSSSRTVGESVLSGSGVAANANASGTPTLYVSSSNLAFGSVTVGSSLTLPVTLASIGSAPVTISSISIGGAGFSVSGATFPMTLSQHSAVTLNLSFTPVSASTVTGMLTINSNSSTGTTNYINMIGTGSASTTGALLTMSSNYLSFGNVPLGSRATLPVTLTSTGSGALTISSASLGGSGYSLSGASFPLTLNPQQSVTLQINFSPQSAGTWTGTLILNSNSSINPTAYINMAGTGVAAGSPQLSVSPTSLSFGDVTVGSNPTLNVMLTSTGSSPVTVNSAAISGGGFTLSGASFPVTLNPQQAVSLSIQFAPASAGASTGKLVISSSSATVTVSLSGTGSSGQHQVNLSWSAPTNSPVAVSGYNIYRATGSSSSYQLLNSAINTQTAYVDSAVASGTTYRYYVTSVGSSGMESAPSNSFSVAIP
ncbi:choice-of-anchor D domain-containing protein [Alloacidobacterium dinghuense]|uniref:Choice-of-anchor D domain-containing protein n=1 Tax=Alloacidobacterium dinghuense TaxID=2763107 RepID=A0A7G8BLQ1_9BACT|nr:choice-of-anchor D domain-containing protein [Alloacidobacterium dinghuense]